MNALKGWRSLGLRKFWIPWAAVIILGCFSTTLAQTSYKIVDQGINNPKDNFSMGMGLNAQGWTENMDGTVNPPEASLLTTVARGRAVINAFGINIDLGTLGKPGANSWINWGGINNFGEAVGQSETTEMDPNGEDICGFGTHLTCVPFIWRFFRMSALPTLGGYNGQASAINNFGQAVGFAENGALDSTCPSFVVNNRIALPALWGNRGNVDPLPLLPHDFDGFAFGINDRGEAVGYSGNCIAATHAVMWKNNKAHQLQDLGGSGSNFAYVINDRGQIAGQVGAADNSTGYAAVWLQGVDGPATNLGFVPGDASAFATGLNNRGQVVGNSLDASPSWAHGFIWNGSGAIIDFNTLIPKDSNLFVINCSNINDRGQVSGMGIVMSGPAKGEIHAFLATPSNERLAAGMSVADVTPVHPQANSQPMLMMMNKLLMQRTMGMMINQAAH